MSPINISHFIKKKNKFDITFDVLLIKEESNYFFMK